MLSGDGGAGIVLQGKGVAADNTDTKNRKVGRAFHGHCIPPSNRLAQVSEKYYDHPAKENVLRLTPRVGNCV